LRRDGERGEYWSGGVSEVGTLYFAESNDLLNVSRDVIMPY